MKLVIGSDHAGYGMKEVIKKHLIDAGHTVMDVGTDSMGSVHYPIYGEKAAMEIVKGNAELGILVCGTGIGIGIAANKVNGIRCAHCQDSLSAKYSRQHNDANMVSFGARIIGEATAIDIVDEFISTEFDGGRHQLRVDMLSDIEKRN